MPAPPMSPFVRVLPSPALTSSLQSPSRPAAAAMASLTPAAGQQSSHPSHPLASLPAWAAGTEQTSGPVTSCRCRLRARMHTYIRMHALALHSARFRAPAGLVSSAVRQWATGHAACHARMLGRTLACSASETQTLPFPVRFCCRGQYCGARACGQL